jgi:hypothetical protein
VSGDFSLDALEREPITRVIARTATLEEATAMFEIDTSTLWRKRKKYENSKEYLAQLSCGDGIAVTKRITGFYLLDIPS